MPNAMKGIEFLYNNPKARAHDLMEAFVDTKIKAIITMIGGDDTIRPLPFIDFNILRNNPKIFMGYSDTTVNHLMYKGITSFYGPCIFAEFAENVVMHDYTKQYIKQILFEKHNNLTISSSSKWTSELLDWANSDNNSISRVMVSDKKGYELLQGDGIVKGTLLRGCIDVLPMIIGTEIWPCKEEWRNCILFLETYEEFPNPNNIKYLLCGLVA